MSEQEARKLTFKYVFPEGLKDLYINGVYGGLTFDNKITMHLFSERLPIPKEETHRITPEGTLGDKIEVKTGGDAIRLIQCSAIMEPTTAQVLINWLQEKLDFLSKEKSDKNTEEQ
jgi:hypothetical protein